MFLNEYLKKNNISDVKFAKIIGISPVTLLNYKKRKFRPSRHIAEKIVAYTKGEVTYPDLGFRINGDKLPYRLDEIKTEGI